LIKAMRVSSSNTSDGEFKTADGNHILRVPVNHSDLSPINQPVFLAIRPEHVQIDTNGAQTANSLRGNIREIVFAGATSTVLVDAAGLLLEALVLQPRGLKINQECTVVLPQDRLTLLQNQRR
jgi:hypothetical protein